MLSEIIYDIVAKISLLPTEMGGRKNTIASGYRPLFSFNTKQYYTGEIILGKIKELKPGSSATALIKLFPAKHLRKNLKPNDTFSISEGEKRVGTGIIEKVTVVNLG